MKILKRQLAWMLVLAMTLTMLPMPAHADEVTEPEAPSAIVEEAAEKTEGSGSEVSTDTANKTVENTDSDTTATESAVPAAETSAETAADSDAAATENLAADVSEDTPVSDAAEEFEEVTDTDDTAENAEAKKDTDADATVESEEDSGAADTEESENAEDSEPDTQEETEQTEAETEAADAAAFSLRRSAANAVTAECDHPETEIAWDTKDQVINCKPISNTQHQISGYQYRYCTSCYERVGESFAATEMGSHELNADGDCDMCGYSSNTGSGSGSGSEAGSDNDCDHVNTAIGWDPDQLGPWYAQCNDTQHKVSGFRYTYCTDCRARIRGEYGSNNNYFSEEVESHTLNASGECTLCGYGVEPPCYHVRDSDSAETSDADDPWYEQCNEDTHYIYRTLYYDCLYCGERMEETGYVFRNEPHVPENGVCIYCDLYVGENYCPHPTKEYIWDTDYPFAYEPYNADYHKKGGYQYAYCTDCSNRVRESYQTWNYEGHSLNTSGKCTLCGYESDEKKECAHEHTIEVWDTNYPYDYISVSDTSHYAIGYMYRSCYRCSERLGESHLAMLSQGHHPDSNGVCAECGNSTDCRHSYTMERWDTEQALTYTQYNDTQHKTSGYKQNVCSLCNDQVGESFVAEEYEDHVMPNNSNSCPFCKYIRKDETSCAHENTETVTSTQLVIQSLTHHTLETTTYEECTTCHEKLNEVTDVQWVEHTPVDGNSYGHEAAHDHKKYYICECGAHPYLEGQFHTANGEVQEESVCCICHGHKYGEEEETPDGTCQKVCTNCGIASVTHKHEYEVIQTTELVNQSLTHHTVETTTYKECSDCHKKTEPVENVVWVEHKAESSSYEAEHPHQKYFICKCGSHPYIDGEYVTANGKVQEEAACCVCHGHKYGAEEETPEGTVQKTCVNCGIRTVTHEHDYELIQTTKLINPDETKHIKQTKSEQKCKTCGHTKPGNEEIIEESHSPKNSEDCTYGSDHPHQRYAVCECGKEFNVPGEYEKVNGKLLEPEVCCICHGHKYGEAAEAADGTWKKTCANCGLSQKVAAPVQPTEPEEEKHVHSYHDIEYIDGTAHPHRYVLKCSCGHEKTGKGSYMLCCQCVGHDWSDIARLQDGKTYQICCFRCKESQKVTPSAQLKDFYQVVDIITDRHNVAKQYQKDHEINSAATTIWKTVADQAAELLENAGFVGTNEAIDAAKAAGNLIKVGEEVAKQFIYVETWDEQQTEIWTNLLCQMLLSERTNSIDISNVEVSAWAKGFASFEKQLVNTMKIITSDSSNMSNLSDEAQKNLKEIANNSSKGSMDPWKAMGYIVDWINIFADGANKAAVVEEYNEILAELRRNVENIYILEEIINSASALGNDNLFNAATQLHKDLQEAVNKQTDTLFSSFDALWGEIAKKGTQWGAKEIGNKLLKAVTKDTKILNPLTVITIGAYAADALLGWGPIYDEAQMIMTLNQMDASLNIAKVLKTVDNPYMADLWGMLQAEGCDYAKKLLDSVKDAQNAKSDQDMLALVNTFDTGIGITVWKELFGADLKDDFGIDDGGFFGKSDLPKVLNEIDEERDYYITELGLPLEKSD